MARRRRSNNPLLLRILGVSAVVNVVVLAIAAQFGALKSIQRALGDVKVVLISPKEVPAEKAKPVERKKSMVKAAVRKGSGNPHRSAGPARPNPNQPKVVAGPADNSGTSDTPTADVGGTLAPGSIPGAPGGGNKDPKPTPAPPVKIAPSPPSVPTEIAKPTPIPKPEPPLAPAKFEESEPISSPSPELPDDLRTENLDKDYIAEFTVGPDGVPESVRTFQSTGIQSLDRIALETAQKWRFRPAKLGGVATRQTVRLKIEFRVQ